MFVMLERSLRANAGLPRIHSSQRLVSACYWTLCDLLTIRDMLMLVSCQIYLPVCNQECITKSIIMFAQMATMSSGVEPRNLIDGKLQRRWHSSNSRWVIAEPLVHGFCTTVNHNHGRDSER